MLSDGVILLHEFKNCCKSSSGKSGALPPPCSPDSAPNLSSKHLSGIIFSLNSDVKTAVENWQNGQGRDFKQSGLNQLVVRSDKCLNRFSDYVEK
ncbi:hypothetical protein AVEN_235778-1 [Araneus ventricosus]|uniref:Uncharacterized protein n=1 Tax=Araneus ventricosus TaxID=182803 RepID=A0A4Y2HLP7_ARAVE|nr:hypothetical protein AVEN_235778-1 [Araneus ventricosus]